MRRLQKQVSAIEILFDGQPGLDVQVVILTRPRSRDSSRASAGSSQVKSPTPFRQGGTISSAVILPNTHTLLGRPDQVPRSIDLQPPSKCERLRNHKPRWNIH
ncbi:hypothetical protein N9M41_06590 [Rhodopirellula sp.]|nr:hypothetical protein [Rhodopirellula sp.]